MKKIILSVLTLAIFVVPSLILADNDSTITYLQTQTQNSWISQALASADVSNVDISYIDYDTDDLMTASKNILTLAAIKSQDNDNINKLLAVIDSNKNDGQFGSSDLLNDDYWAIMALASVGHLENTDSIKNFILSHQNSDGGWSWATNGESDSNDTAASIMALYDLGLNSSSTEIVNALAYLQSIQNGDGGFGYDVDSSSDGASSAWVLAVLNKLGSDLSTWTKDNNTIVSFLKSLRQDDGSFLWMPSDEQGSSMVSAYALLALSGKTYPVNYIDIASGSETDLGYTLRIEGPDDTICLANNLEANTVLDLLDLGADVCDFEYLAQDSAYGVYISAIDGIAGEGLNGWQYFVDYQPATVAAGDYILEGNREVLWSYGGWPFYAVKLEVNDTQLNAGDDLVATFSYHDGDNWLPLANADVMLNTDVYQTDSLGQFTFNLSSDGVFSLFSKQGDKYARSNKEYIIVGDGLSKTVDLSVKIESGSGGGTGEDTIAFSVDRSSIDFGTLSPGETADTIISLNNTGNVDIYIEASVLGDDIFSDFTSLNQKSWEDYNLNLTSNDIKSVNVGLSIPSDFDSLGQKEGQLIFWGINQ